ncbi:hypothetical protein M8C21_021067, partial [Ambrosia artemisiifolia]
HGLRYRSQFGKRSRSSCTRHHPPIVLAKENVKESTPLCSSDDLLSIFNHPLAIVALVPKDVVKFARSVISGVAVETVIAPLAQIKLILHMRPEKEVWLTGLDFSKKPDEPKRFSLVGVVAVVVILSYFYEANIGIQSKSMMKLRSNVEGYQAYEPNMRDARNTEWMGHFYENSLNLASIENYCVDEK